MFRPRSPENSTGQEEEWGEEAKDFYDYYGPTRNEIIVYFKNPDKEITVGPKYKTYTSHGQEVESYTFFIQNKISRSQSLRSFYVFSFSVNGNFLGFRHIDLVNNLASGVISTRFRDKKISGAIDLVTLDILQAEVNKDKGKGVLVWKISNQNLSDLSEINALYDSGELDDYNLVKEKRLEQKRWADLYGENGKLGTKKTGRLNENYIELEKSLTDSDLQNENAVELLRKTGETLGVGKRITEPFSNSDSEKKIKQQRLEIIKKFVLDSNQEGSKVIDLRS